MVVQITEFALNLTGVYQVKVGETWRVYVSFQYTAPQDTTVTLRASPYNRIAGVLNRIQAVAGSTDIDLAAALTPTAIEASVDIYFKPKAEGGIDDATYGLIAEIVGTDVYQNIDSCLVVSGNPEPPPGIWSMLPMLMVVMVMGMMTSFMGEE